MDCVLHEAGLPVVCACLHVCLYIHVVQHICEGPVVCGGPALADGIYDGSHVHTCRCLPAGRELSRRPCSSEDKHRPPACRVLGHSE